MFVYIDPTGYNNPNCTYLVEYSLLSMFVANCVNAFDNHVSVQVTFPPIVSFLRHPVYLWHLERFADVVRQPTITIEYSSKSIIKKRTLTCFYNILYCVNKFVCYYVQTWLSFFVQNWRPSFMSTMWKFCGNSHLISRICADLKLTCAAMMRCRSTTNWQLGHIHSRQRHNFLCPFKQEITPWFRHRAHFGVRKNRFAFCDSVDKINPGFMLINSSSNDMLWQKIILSFFSRTKFNDIFSPLL